MRRSISAITLALATGISYSLSPVASAAASSGLSTVSTSTVSASTVSTAPGPLSLGKFGVRIVDVPVAEADNPRALRYIIDYLPTGTVIHRRILIENDEPRTSRFTVYADAAHITGGQFIGYAGATRNELTGWIGVQHPTVTLAAGASVMDLITIKVPPGATRGEHYGVIWVQQAAGARTARGFAVDEVARVGMRIYLAVGRGGAPPTSFDITSITGHRSAGGQPVLVAKVDNTGGRAVDLDGTALLADGPGNSRAGPFSSGQITTLAPGQSGTLTFAPPASLPDGPWRATVSLVSGLTTATASATVRFTAVVAAQAGLSDMQWVWLALGGLALVLVVVMGWYALQRRRRQVPA